MRGVQSGLSGLHGASYLSGIIANAANFMKLGAEPLLRTPMAYRSRSCAGIGLSNYLFVHFLSVY